MSEEFKHKECKGSLFKSDKKEKETDRDFQGSCVINGEEFWISGWVNEKKSDGGKYFGLAFQSKQATHEKGVAQAQQAANSVPQAPPAGFDDFTNDEIPF